MDVRKDYYAILGVLPSIDEVALGAVYRALLKKYHPDVYKGSKADAENRTRDIIEAYAVLSDLERRSAFDAARKTTEAGYGSYEGERSWKFGLR